MLPTPPRFAFAARLASAVTTTVFVGAAVAVLPVARVQAQRAAPAPFILEEATLVEQCFLTVRLAGEWGFNVMYRCRPPANCGQIARCQIQPRLHF